MPPRTEIFGRSINLNSTSSTRLSWQESRLRKSQQLILQSHAASVDLWAIANDTASHAHDADTRGTPTLTLVVILADGLVCPALLSFRFARAGCMTQTKVNDQYEK